MKHRLDLVIILLLVALLSIALMTVSQAETSPPQSPSKWNLDLQVQLLAGIALLLIVSAGTVLYYYAKQSGDSFIVDMRPHFFFWLGMTYTMLLLLGAIIYNAAYTGQRPYLFGNMLPIAVPWFGALGAVTISLEGVFTWSDSRWNPQYNYWHLGRPFFGAVLGTVAFFIYVLIVSSSGAFPAFLQNPMAETSAKDFIIYYVVAFLVGYREATFRELIQRVTDMILKPAAQSITRPEVVFRIGGVAQSKIEFKVPVGKPITRTIEIVTLGSVPLSQPKLTMTTTDASSKDVFKLDDHVSSVNELVPNRVATVDITFDPPKPGAYSAVLSVSGTNLDPPATIRVVGDCY